VVPQTPPTAAAVRQQRPPPWRDVRVLRVVLQVAFAIAVVALLWFLASNLLTNLRSAGLPTGFDYLGRPHGTDIRDSDFRPSQAVRAAIIVALVNTVRVASVGILLASVLGLLIGLARLSTNWLVRRAAAAYVELLRNVPVLVIIIFMYVAVILRLPPISRPIEAVGAFVFSNRGLAVPWGESEDGAGGFTLVLLVALVVALAVAWWRTRRNERTGEPHHRFLWGLGVFAGVAALGWVVLGGPVTLTVPTRDGRVVAGGINLGPEYAAVLIGLVIYTASHIAEITRGSILAVPKGQSEAANAVALSGFQRLRYVVLPQALRIAVPPVANQYLNLTKNSSLAVFVGYFELTRITGQIIANGNPAPQSIAVLMACYLALSLAISAVANLFNRSLALKGRT
jgi:general L-amino acid transport system permease protein